MNEWKPPSHRVYVVSLPRCGSSMMTGVVERLGVDVKHTTEDDKTRERAQEQYRQKFGDYVPNERFYEITHDQFQHWMDIYNTPYSGCKVIIPVQGMRWEAMCSQPCKVILMSRNPAEIRQSQEAFYKRARANYEGDGDPAEIAEAHLATMLAMTRVMFDRRTRLSHDTLFDTDKTCVNGVTPRGCSVPLADSCPASSTCNRFNRVQPFDYKVVEYRDVLSDPEKVVTEVADFIGAERGRVPYAVASIDTKKIRFKSEELEKGI